MKTAAPVQVLAHTRISEAEDDDKTPEADVQLHDIRVDLNAAFGPEGEGWVLVKHNHEHDTSAWRKNLPRPVFDDTLALCRTGSIDVLAAWSPDRVYRRTDYLARVIDALGDDPRTGVKFLCHQGGKVDFSTATGRMMARTMANFAEYESDIKSERIRAQQAHANRQGWAPTVPCNGYWRESWGRKQGGTLHVIQAEAEQIELVVQLLIDPPNEPEGLSPSAVADWLNDLGMLRYERNRQMPEDEGLLEGRMPWTTSAIRKLLASPTLAGLLPDPDGEPGDYVKGNWEPILPPDVWVKVNEELFDPARKHRRKRSDYWLRGSLLDVHGQELRGGRIGEGSARRAYSSPTHKGTPRPTSTIDAVAIETFMLNLVESVLPELSWIDEGPTVVSEAEREVARLEERLAELSVERENGEITKAEWQASRKAVMAKLDAARKEARIVRRHGRGPGVRPGDLVRRWNLHPSVGGLGDQERHRLVRWAIGAVTVLPAAAVKGRFEPTPEKIAARLVLAEDSPLVAAQAAAGRR